MGISALTSTENRCLTNSNDCSTKRFDIDKGAIALSIEAINGLKQLCATIDLDTINHDDLLKELRAVYFLVHRLFNVQCREILDDDSDFSDLLRSFEENQGYPVTPVSSEIKSWLETTFTKNTNWKASSVSPRLTFKQAAIKIKARVKLHRIFGSGCGFDCLQPNQEAENMFKEYVGDWSFDIFQLDCLLKTHVLCYTGIQFFKRNALHSIYHIPMSILEAFLCQLEEGYSKHGNPYHNMIHAADVVQTCNSIIEQAQLKEFMTHNEIFALVFAALIHDLEHTGTTNAFQVNVGSYLALLYNDRGVLENHHLSTAFRLTQLPAFNIFSNVVKKDFKDIRQLTIELVLNTDMSLHFTQIKGMNKLINLPEPIEKSKIYSLILHCADISHPTKCWELHNRWTNMLVQEFFSQGDREIAMGLSPSPLCDRLTTIVPQSQIGFINFIVTPSFQVLEKMLKRVYAESKSTNMSEMETAANEIIFPASFNWIQQLNENKFKWQAITVEPGELQKDEN